MKVELKVSIDDLDLAGREDCFLIQNNLLSLTSIRVKSCLFDSETAHVTLLSRSAPVIIKNILDPTIRLSCWEVTPFNLNTLLMITWFYLTCNWSACQILGSDWLIEHSGFQGKHKSWHVWEPELMSSACDTDSIRGEKMGEVQIVKQNRISHVSAYHMHISTTSNHSN